MWSAQPWGEESSVLSFCDGSAGAGIVAVKQQPKLQ